MDDKQKLSDFLLMKLQECKLKPHDGAIYGEAADYIAEQLVVEGYCKPRDVVSVAKDKEQQIANIQGIVTAALTLNEYGLYGQNARLVEKLLRGCSWSFIAEALYAAGYRKQSDVVREFLQRLKEKESPKLLTWEYGEGYLDCLKMAEELAAEFGAEVK